MMKLDLETVQPRHLLFPLGTHDVAKQERVIVDDLFSVLLGLDGNFIDIVDEESEDKLRHVNFIIDDTLLPSLRELALRILPAAQDYILLEDFIRVRSAYEYGCVNHALCAAIADALTDYKNMVMQLEHNAFIDTTFSINKLYVYMLRSMPVMDQLARLAESISSADSYSDEAKLDKLAADINLPRIKGSLDYMADGTVKGGAILGVLADRMSRIAGGAKIRKMYCFLMEHAALPYFKMLMVWLDYGTIRDIYGEFLIKEDTRLRVPSLKESDLLDAYWERRYQIREEAVPRFLEPIKEKILLAGKYLNVLYECGHDKAPIKEKDEDEELDDESLAVARSEAVQAMNGNRYLKHIERAYRNANRRLLNVVLSDYQLLARLRSIKRYFLLDQADFLTHFLDLSYQQLELPYHKVPVDKLQSLLELVLRNPASVTATDPYKDELRVGIQSKGVKLLDEMLRVVVEEGMTEEQLKEEKSKRVKRPVSPSGSTSAQSSGNEAKGFETLQLSYNVPFPLSLILTHQALLKYQLVFRHLLQLKWTERQLCQAWQLQSRSHIWRDASRRAWNIRNCVLRMRMLVFVQQMLGYIALEIVEPSWRELHTKLSQNTTMDQLITNHYYFIDKCIEGAMLTCAPLLRHYRNIMSVSLGWCSWSSKYTAKLSDPMQNITNDFLLQQEKNLTYFEQHFNEEFETLKRILEQKSRLEFPAMSALLMRLQHTTPL